ncbi:MAG: alpha-glucosidase C-terminal domain-containing protein, partial [Alphaproteobacteria bacterium]|nr:alpha-glucosidase C-terminal domain-containing protein [Alphaproteobacteria bacterium]
SHAPYLQFHHYDSNLPEDIEVLDEIRRVVERYPDRFVMGEFSEDPARCGCFAAPDEGLHSGYSFPLLKARELGPGFVHLHYNLLSRFPAHWPSVAFSNHDVMRTVSRFGGPEPPEGLGKLLLALLLSLKGTALLYQGEELALPEADIRRDQIRDPVGDLYWPYTGGRDGCRTPMPWDAAAANLGFSTGTPWLPLSRKHQALAVSHQEGNDNSALDFMRRFSAFRQKSAALRWGEIRFVDAPPPLLAFEREYEGDKLLCLFNMSGEATEFRDESILEREPLEIGCGAAARQDGLLKLGPYSSWFAALSNASSTASMGNSTQ